MNSILEQIQGEGNDKLEHTNEKASQLTLLLEKARTFYADNAVKETIRDNLVDNVIRLQGMISRYASDIDKLLATGQQPDAGTVGSLKNEYTAIRELEKDVQDDLNRLELKH